MGFLDDYRKQVEIDKAEQNDDLPQEKSGVDVVRDEEYQDAYKKELKRLRNDPNDIENAYRKFQEEYIRISEEQLDTEYSEQISFIEPSILIKRFMCPKCGKEIISKSPVMYNPFTLEKVAKHECECGFKCNLEYAYPRLMAFDDYGNEIVAYPR